MKYLDFEIDDNNTLLYKGGELNFKWTFKTVDEAKQFADYLFKAWGYVTEEEVK